MNVLSLFDGMACGRLALEKAGIKVDNYYASEIDVPAMKIAKKNWPDIIHIGDVQKVKGEDLPKIDLIIGGSPCQGFSFAGKMLNFEDPRSKLFFEFSRLVDECKPKYFFLENVKMKKESVQVITEELGVDPVEINSALVSAQSRRRLYWSNIPIEQPVDKNIKLIDILQTDVAEKYFASEEMMINYDGGQQLNPKYQSQANQIHDIMKAKMQAFCAFTHGYAHGYIKHPNHNYITDRVKSRCLDAHYGKTGNLKSYFAYGERQLIFEKKEQLTKNKFNYRIRKLTPIEAERLQTVPDDYTSGVADTQRYKMLGNGWTVDVIAHIFSKLKNKDLILKTPYKQATLF